MYLNSYRFDAPFYVLLDLDIVSASHQQTEKIIYKRRLNIDKC